MRFWIDFLPPGKRGASWYIVGVDASGRFEASTGIRDKRDRRAAEAFGSRFLDERARRRVPGAGETVGFRSAAAFYKAASPHLSKQDIAKVDAVAAEIGDVDCRSVTHAHLVAAADALKPGRADSTKNRWVIGPGAAVLHYAAGQKWCDYQRLKKFWESRKSGREPARDEDLAVLIANVEAPPRAKKNGRKADYHVAFKRILLMMLYETGLRLGHLLAVRVPHFDLQANTVRVRIPKSDEWAVITLSAELVAAIANCLHATRTGPVRRPLGVHVPREGRFFPWATNSGVYAWLKPLRKRLGVTYTPHMSRHALATDADAAQIPDKRAAELGVWQDPRSLHRYQHVRPIPIAGRTIDRLLSRPVSDHPKSEAGSQIPRRKSASG